jgi:effector-binding domain-containing protein
MDYKCELHEKPAQPVLSIRTRAAVSDLPSVLGTAYNSLMGYLAQIGEQPVGAPFVAYYNMDMQDLDIEVGFPVSKVLTGKDEIIQSEIPAGKHVSCIHVGPYSKVEQAYNALTQWIEKTGFTPTGISYEFYLNDPSTTPENELMTKVVFPVK